MDDFLGQGLKAWCQGISSYYFLDLSFEETKCRELASVATIPSISERSYNPTDTSNGTAAKTRTAARTNGGVVSVLGAESGLPAHCPLCFGCPLLRACQQIPWYQAQADMLKGGILERETTACTLASDKKEGADIAGVSEKG
ncbi:hypothetical protein P7K49_001614 [Saguinus oedipus]|uniref:Uncharacterized protein n=1 Tax=Saguinus oedipus TaxID=9490 RepID=A0ABQ9WF22_SAGOE|nr:hypothetical protein P7K49_001614 [Saguinus oedipus]